MTFRTCSACFLLLFAAFSPLFAQVGVGPFEYVSTDPRATPSAGQRSLGNSSAPVKKIHVVQPGESLYGISQVYKVDLEMLRSLNNLSDNVILPNQQLVVGIESGVARGGSSGSVARSLDGSAQLRAKDPAYTTRTVQQTSYDFHEVKEGETLESIADTYDQSVDSLVAWNGSYTVSPLDVIRVRCISQQVSYAVPVGGQTASAASTAATPPAASAAFMSTARSGSAATSAAASAPSPLDAPAPPAEDAPAPTQNWQTSPPPQAAPDQSGKDENEAKEEEGEAGDEEVPVIRTEKLNLDSRNQQLENAAEVTEAQEEGTAEGTAEKEEAGKPEEKEDEQEEETAPASRSASGNALLRQAGPHYRNAAVSTTPASTPITPPSPLDDVAATPDPAAAQSAESQPAPVIHEPLESPIPATRQHVSTATVTQGLTQVVTPATLEEGVLETGAFAVLDLPAGTKERFVVYHKQLPAGTLVRILLPNNSGFVVAKVAGGMTPGSTERFALSPACVALLRAAGVSGNTATIAYK